MDWIIEDEREFTVESSVAHDDGADRGGYQTTTESVKLVGDPADSQGLKLEHSWYCSHDKDDDEWAFSGAQWEPQFTSKESVVSAIESTIEEYLEKVELLKRTLLLAQAAVAFETDYEKEEDEDAEDEE